jgi:ADP-heptose:LPS heptosyltransferase
MKKRERILILNISGIGDFVDSTPALQRARQLRPDAWITLAVSEKAFPLARTCPYVNEVVSIPTFGGRNFPHWRDGFRWMRQVLRLRHFNTAINIYRVATTLGSWWMRILLAWSGATITIGINYRGLASFYTRCLSPEDIPVDQLEKGIRVVELLDPSKVSTTPPGVELWIEPAIIKEVGRWVRQQTGPSAHPLVVFLGGERFTRHESPGRAEAWLTAIQQHWDIYPIVIGAATDPGLPPGTKVVHSDLRGQYSIERSAALISCASALITTHSAPQHFASVWQIPTVVLVGPGDSTQYRPHVQAGKMRMLRNPVDCSPCYFLKCPWTGQASQKCLTGISIDSIVHAFDEIFSKTPTR